MNEEQDGRNLQDLLTILKTYIPVYGDLKFDSIIKKAIPDSTLFRIIADTVYISAKYYHLYNIYEAIHRHMI